MPTNIINAVEDAVSLINSGENIWDAVADACAEHEIWDARDADVVYELVAEETGIAAARG
jgi:hypothetical protein